MLIIEHLADHKEYAEEVTKMICKEFGDEDNYKLWESIVSHSMQKDKLPLTFVALEDNKLAGTVGLWRADLLSRQDLYPWLSALFVKEEYRGKKIGQELQKFLVDYCRENRYKELFLYTDLENYYEKTGWNHFESGIETLLLLRKKMMEEILEFKNTLNTDEFSAIPFINADRFHSKTIAYSLYHTFRIEDIVSHSLIKKDTQIFFSGDYQSRLNSPIITTGNELVKEEISEFSSKLNLNELYKYIADVDNSTTELLRNLTYDQLKIKMTEEDKENLHKLKTVSEDEKAVFLLNGSPRKNGDTVSLLKILMPKLEGEIKVVDTYC